MRPFPIGADKTKVDTNRYRHDMIKNTGISIFLLGNKEDHGSIVESNGMDEEWYWSKDQCNLLIPVGCTGYRAKAYFNELYASFPTPEYEDYKAEMDIIGDETKAPEQVLDAIMTIITEANK